MGSILPFLPRGVFDDAATKAMGEAFDEACTGLYGTGTARKGCAGSDSAADCRRRSQRRA